jgi:hypothetical protein
VVRLFTYFQEANMKALLVAASLVLAGAVANAAPCLPGSLQNYIDLGSAGCSAGDIQFTNFAIAPGIFGATIIDPLEVQVTPGGSAFLPNLTFGLGVSAGAGDLHDLFFRFNLTGPALTGSRLTLTGAGATGDGVVTGIGNFCLGASFPGNEPTGCPTQSDSLIAFATATDSQLVDSRQLLQSSFFDVFVNLTVDGGPAGTAGLQSGTIEFNAVPEPSTAVLFLTAFGIALFKRLGGRKDVSK